MSATVELGTPRLADGHGEGSAVNPPRYALVHLVAQEIHKGLIDTQVVDHMACQAATPGTGAPGRVAVAFLEPARWAFRAGVRRRARELARRAPGVRIRVWPFVGRFGVRLNAWLFALRARRLAGGLPVVFHCRAESAVAWAVAMREWIPGAAIIADMRGVWPEELLHMRGIDDPADADPVSHQAYSEALAEVRRALHAADGILAVSEPLRDWLAMHETKGRQAVVVPCCVAGVAFTEETRRRRRAQLGVDGKLVLAYLGSVVRYQHVEDGFLQFARHAVARLGAERVHLLCITPDDRRMREMVSAAALSGVTTSILTVPQDAVADYLCAADAGFLLRADSRVNRVSVPVKLGEYLASGVPVVVSRVDGWVSTVVERCDAGVGVDWFEVSDSVQCDQAARALDGLTRRADELRRGALELCRTQFLWSLQVPRVRGVYTKALSSAALRCSSAA